MNSKAASGRLLVRSTRKREDTRVGVLVQCNYGDRDELRIAGIPVGREIPDGKVWHQDVGSIIIVVATDAPLIPTQLKRVVMSESRLDLDATAAIPATRSGDIFIAFSTANPGTEGAKKPTTVTMIPNDDLDPIFLATVRATEEAIVNAMIAAETMTGVNDRTVIALLPRQAARGVEKA